MFLALGLSGGCGGKGWLWEKFPVGRHNRRAYQVLIYITCIKLLFKGKVYTLTFYNVGSVRYISLKTLVQGSCTPDTDVWMHGIKKDNLVGKKRIPLAYKYHY